MPGELKNHVEKDRETDTWELNWWNLLPLCNDYTRPIAWTPSNLIYTSHSTQTLVQRQPFRPSLDSKLLPMTVMGNAYFRSQASIISISPREDMIFAYFPIGLVETPADRGAGVGIVYERALDVDQWSIRASWVFPEGDGAVEAKWLLPEREWLPTEPPSRAPSSGPTIPTCSHALLIVSQSHSLRLYYRPYISDTSPAAMRNPVKNFKLITGYVLQSHHANERGPPQPVPHPSLHASRVVSKASIGLAFGEPNILIASRSRLVSMDARTSDPASGQGMGLSPEDILDPVCPQWESWGEETTIDICVARVQLDQGILAIKTHPLASLVLSDLSPTSLISSLLLTPVIPPRVPLKAENDDPSSMKPSFFLTASFMEFGDYTLPPKSVLYSYEIVKPNKPESANAMVWNTNAYFSHFSAKRELSSSVIGFVEPATPRPDSAGLLVGLLNTSGVRHPHSKEVPVGTTCIWQLPSLQDDPQWEPAKIFSAPEDAGRNPPLAIAVSPNRTLIALASGSSLQSHGTRSTICAYPKPRLEGPLSDIRTKAILPSLLNRHISPADIIHDRVMTNASVLCDVLGQLSTSALKGVDWTAEILGLAVEMYRRDGNVHEDKWRAARDICSVAEVLRAFDSACEPPNFYEITFTPILLDLTKWFVELMQRTLCECVIFESEAARKLEKRKIHSGSTSDPREIAERLRDLEINPIVITVLHPYSRTIMMGVITHMIRFKMFIRLLNGRTPAAAAMKAAYLDLFDKSHLNWENLFKAFVEAHKEQKDQTEFSGIFLDLFGHASSTAQHRVEIDYVIRDRQAESSSETVPGQIVNGVR
ncbi:hypothetical protein SISNIDRAFT_487912 [Sistotremastrum niveocremeum HHB9708]|uniref:Uncharacterized protein n=1 Tax=Sistotremastrum niveocremeum HHB9708 TaxID=1314777 RepID=A0A164RUC6_9AGAM|nr:hypothetical protein SISNIDRAFT_487912 [Sistotremastrum niveocremeum HHB9708]